MKRTLKIITGALAVLLLACLMVMPAAADDYYKGAVPVTKLSGTMNGSVDVLYANAWNTTPVTDWSGQENTTEFTLEIDPSEYDIAFARLYVVPYLGSMSADYCGTLTVEVEGTTAVNAQPLDLSYDRTVGATAEADLTGNLINLTRVTSDYVAVLDITDIVSYMNDQYLDVYVETTNVSGKFDGRIKEVKVVYGWYDESADTIKYWINEGHDTVTGKDTYVGETTFDVGALGTVNSAKLYTDAVASSAGTYDWNTNTGISYSAYMSGAYSQFKEFNLNTAWINSMNTLYYHRGGYYYKNILDVLVLS